MRLFPLKWEPTTHSLLAETTLDCSQVPMVAHDQVHTLLARLGDDATWVKQPLVHTLEAGYGFSPEYFGHLVAASVECPDRFDRAGWLSGLSALAQKYPLIPRVLWDTIAAMGLRPEPHREDAIPNLGGILVHPWTLADAALHAAAKATAFWADICHELEKHSGFYPEHGCGCDHIVRDLQSGFAFPPMPSDRLPHAHREWWEHFLAELALIHVMGFPFSLHASVKTYEGTLIPVSA